MDVVVCQLDFSLLFTSCLFVSVNPSFFKYNLSLRYVPWSVLLVGYQPTVSV